MILLHRRHTVWQVLTPTTVVVLLLSSPKDCCLHAQTEPPTITQPAHVEPYEKTEILAKASGFVSRVNVDIGGRVEKDDLLAELWIPEMDQERLVRVAAVDEAAAAVRQMDAAVGAARSRAEAASARLAEVRASVAQYEADVAFRQSEFDRVGELVSKQALNQKLLDEKQYQLRSAQSALAAATAAVASAEASLQVEQAGIEQAQANLAHAQARHALAEANLKKTEVLMSYAQIRAPFAGLISERSIDTGDFVASAVGSREKPLFTLVRVDRLRIIVDIPESQAPRVSVGQPAELTVDALKGVTFPGAVARTTGVLDPRTRTLRIEAELKERTGELKPGMYGSLTITLLPRDASE
jgi:multidrug resistance efflux pump